MHEVLGSNLTGRSGGRYYFFLKLGGPLVPVGVTHRDYPLVPVRDPGLKEGPLVPDAYSRVGNRD